MNLSLKFVLSATLLFVSANSHSYSTHSRHEWLVISASSSSSVSNGAERVLVVRVRDAESGTSFVLSAPTQIDSISGTLVFSDQLAVFGRAGRADAVQRFDITHRTVTDRFFCYAPKAISKRWIAAVEFYFSSGAAKSTDVLLLYDLSKSPAENHSEKNASPLGDLRATRVGVPIFPELNATQSTYDNSVNSVSDSVGVIGSPMLLLHDHILVFIASHMILDASTLSTNIVVVDLSDSRPRVIRQIPIRVPGIPSTTAAQYVQVEAIRPVSKNLVQLVVDKDRYGVGEFVVDVMK